MVSPFSFATQMSTAQTDRQSTGVVTVLQAPSNVREAIWQAISLENTFQHLHTSMSESFGVVHVRTLLAQKALHGARAVFLWTCFVPSHVTQEDASFK